MKRGRERERARPSISNCTGERTLQAAGERRGSDTEQVMGVNGLRERVVGEALSASRRTVGNHCGRPPAQPIVSQVMPRGEGSDVMDSLRLYLIRHGETAWSLTGQHTGCTDIPLTRHGEQEARELAPLLRRIAFAHVLSSPALRARRTCELAAGGREAEIEPDLLEWDYGDYEGKRTSEIHQERPHWDIWRDGCPNGETPEDVALRADSFLARLRKMRGPIALFSHGQFGCALAVRWVEMPVIAGRHLVLAAASVSCLTHDAGHPRMPVISLWNAVSAVL